MNKKLIQLMVALSVLALPALVQAQFTFTTNNGAITITGYNPAVGPNMVIPAATNGYPVTSIGDAAFQNDNGITNVTIPNSVTSIGLYAFESCTGLTSVTLPDSVTNIGGGAFFYCTGLTSVTIGNGVTSIRTLFAGCTGLTSVTIGNSVTNIGNAFGNAFGVYSLMTNITVDAANPVYSSSNGVLFDKNQTVLLQFPGGKAGNYSIPDSVTNIGIAALLNCTGLTSITVPNSVTSIGEYAFSGCTRLTKVALGNSLASIGTNTFSGSGLTSVTIPNSVTNIENSAFRFCRSLTNVTLGNSVASIGNNAFWFCIGLTSVTIPDSVTNIANNAFGNCSNLTSVTIGNGVTNFGFWIEFEVCSSLTNFSVNAANPVYSSSSGVLFDKNQTELLQFPEGKAGNYTIPNSVTSIGFSAFSYCTRLTSVTIPNSVTYTGAGAFSYCFSLTNITVNAANPVYSSSNGVLFDKNQTVLLQFPAGKAGNYTIPNSVTSIGLYAFESCTGLTSVTIPNSVSSIGRYAFESCTGLTSVTIGNSVASIGGYAFYSCSNLTGVYFGGNSPTPTNGFSVFQSATNTTVYYLPGTTGWGSTFDGRPTALWCLPNPLIVNPSPGFGVQTNQFGFTISWATNSPVVVEACTNLANSVWNPVATNTLTGGSSYFRDPQWTNYPSRFYRLRSP